MTRHLTRHLVVGALATATLSACAPQVLGHQPSTRGPKPTPSTCPYQPGDDYHNGQWTRDGRVYALAPTEDSRPTCL